MPPHTWASHAQIFLHDVARTLALIQQGRLKATPSGRWRQSSRALLAQHTTFSTTEPSPQDEQDAPALSWLRHLLGQTGLFSISGRDVLLSKTVYEWLGRPPHVQLLNLRRLWLWNLDFAWQWTVGHTPSRLLDSWWRSMVLEVLVAVSACPCDSWEPLVELESDLHMRGALDWNHIAQNLPNVANAMARRVPAVLRLLLEDILPCLALVEVQGRGDDAALRPTPEGVEWLRTALARYRHFTHLPANTAVDQDVPYYELHLPERDAPPLEVTANLEVTVALDALPSLTFDVANIAALVDPGPPACYRVTRDSLHHAPAWGYPTADVIFILDRFSGGALPGAARERLQRWQEEAVEIVHEPGYRLRLASPPLLSALRQRKPFRSRTHPFTSGRDVWVALRRAKDLFRYLRRQGYTVSPLKDSENGQPVEWPMRRSLPLRQLLVMLRTYAYLRKLVPGLATFDLDGFEAMLAAALPPGERAGITRLVAAQAAYLVEHIAAGAPEAVAEMVRWLGQAADREHIAEQIQSAIDAETPLHLTYIDNQARITERVVRPLQIEERWSQQYLFAFCEQRQDERHFRLDRIIAIEEAPEQM